MYKQKSLNDFFSPVKAELELTINTLYKSLKSDNDLLNEVVSYTISTGGKHIRPGLSLLSSKLFLEELKDNNITIAQITEIIHTASLLHDDVIDDASLRRGHKTINAIWGNKLSVISGDFLLSRASALLASLNNLYIVDIFSNSIQELCLGEIQQSVLIFNTDITWDEYILKSTRKTARLFSLAMLSAAIISDATKEQAKAVEDFGLYFGLAFQIIDDILNFYTQDQVGKPSCQDLSSGIITAPVIYAMKEHPVLIELINTKFKKENDFYEAVNLIKTSSGIIKSKKLARSYVNMAKDSLKTIKNSDVKDSLIQIAEYVIDREF